MTSDDGLFKFDSEGALILPSGSDLTRPSPMEEGMIRYNLEKQNVEIYDGQNWRGVKYEDENDTDSSNTIIRYNLEKQNVEIYDGQNWRGVKYEDDTDSSNTQSLSSFVNLKDNVIQSVNL